MELRSLVRSATSWWFDTPIRSLDQAYKAALKIKLIEEEHFDGQTALTPNSRYSSSVNSYFQAEINRYLQTIRVKLAEFRTSRWITSIVRGEFIRNSDDSKYFSQTSTLEKLALIDQILAKYQPVEVEEPAPTKIKATTNNGAIRQKNYQPGYDIPRQNNSTIVGDDAEEAHIETVSDKTGVLPRSFLRTFNRIRQEIAPQTEQNEAEVLKKYRRSRTKTAISIRFFLILIIIPLLTHQITKTFIVAPLVERYEQQHQVLFVNEDLEEEALYELQRFEEKLHFKSLIGLSQPLTSEEIELEVREKAAEIAIEYRHYSINAISNIFADLFSLAAFSIIIFNSKKEILVVKSFLDEIVYGLSDSAKAFLIILLTDIFVGYHSPHGWEIILESLARHLGLPENRDFNFLFIATFPVILDTVLKYWIFRYLNRISPSAVATYRNMNE